MTRRLLLVAAALVFASCAARAADPPALAALRSALAVEAKYADDPWALSHALLVFGPGYELASGAKLAARLESFAVADPDGGASYALMGSDGTMGEMHPHLVLKTLAGDGVDPDLCGRLAKEAAGKERRPSTTAEWNDTAWLIEGLARTSGWSAASPLGAPDLTAGSLALGALDELETADAVVAGLLADPDGFRRPVGGGDPSTSGIWAYTCGGQHLMQALLVAEQAGLLPEDAKPRLAKETDLFVRRVKAEAGFRDLEKQRAIAAGVNKLLAEHNAMVQVLKLEGHALETLARARDAGVGDPVSLRAAAVAIRDDLENRLAAFAGVLDLAKLLPSVRAGDPGTWRKWFGDGCHALHGLSLWPDLPAPSAQ